MVASGWTRGRWRPLQPGQFFPTSRNSSDFWVSPTSTGGSSRNSVITSPLISLLRNKSKSLSWKPAATEAFERLKAAFTHAPILVHPDPKKNIQRRGERFYHGGWSRIISAAEDSRQTPSMCLLFQETQPGGEELRHQK